MQTARAAVACRLQRIELELPETPAEPLAAPSGAFVTLRVEGELRGCIGVIEAVRPLIEMVAGCAASAATADQRFPPITLEELPRVRFEISVLSPPRPVEGAEAIVIGRHGVIVSHGGRKGLLLPQVATEQGWGAEDFLTAACRKAGLAPAAWHGGGVRLECFTAEVFGEEP